MDSNHVLGVRSTALYRVSESGSWVRSESNRLEHGLKGRHLHRFGIGPMLRILVSNQVIVGSKPTAFPSGSSGSMEPAARIELAASSIGGMRTSAVLRGRWSRQSDANRP